MKCPNCRKQLSAQHLRESEACAKACASIAGTLAVSRRKQARGGRPRKAEAQQS
jgi:hypothetical protein